jgi:creatinine amidohydrolase/Fe(II)-dependent formamide hydrolase-like protein
VANVAFWQLWHEGVRGLFADVHPYLVAAYQAAELCPEGLTHAGRAETAMMLAACPERVNMAAARDGPDDLWGRQFPYRSLRRPGVYCIPTVEVLPDGVEGKATAATAALGKALLDLYAGALAEILNDLLAGDVPGEFLRPFRKPEDAGQ